MSEEKKASDKILERMEKLETTLKTLIESHSAPPIPESKPQPTPQPQHVEVEAKPAHQSIEEMAECKDCYPKMKHEVVKRDGEQIGKDYMKKTLKERKDFPLVCKECGTRVRKEEENCPTCGSTEAK
jgi:rubrerythrin